MKKCNLCLIEKPLNEYHIDNKKKDGHYDVCKKCRNIKSKSDYEKLKINTKKIIIGKVCVKCLNYKTIEHFHKHISAIDGHRSTCKECRKLQWKDEYPKIAEKHKERTKMWRITNKEKYNKYFAQRYKKLPHIYAWRGMLASTLRRLGTKKEKTTIDMLGYSAEELKTHIESLFLDGMTWENWGVWQIDHIKPVISFDKTTDSKLVNALSNLQPLWREDNLKKRDNF